MAKSRPELYLRSIEVAGPAVDSFFPEEAKFVQRTMGEAGLGSFKPRLVEWPAKGAIRDPDFRA
jgi:hypothetical protein